MVSQNKIEKLSRIGLAVSMAALAVVLGVALTSNSIAILADLCNSVLEFAADLVAYTTFQLLRSSRFSRMEYGLGKFENVAQLFIGLLMFLGAIGLVSIAVGRIAHPEELMGGGIWPGVGSLVFLCVVNGLLWVRTASLAREDSTPLIEAQQQLFRSKTLTDSVLVVSLTAGALLGGQWAHDMDPLGSLVIIAVMLTEAWHLVSHALRDLVDQTINESMQMVVNRHLIRHFESYEMLDRVRSRKSGGDVFIDISLAFKAEQTIGDIQPLIDDLRKAIEAEIRRSHVNVLVRAYGGT